MSDIDKQLWFKKKIAEIQKYHPDLTNDEMILEIRQLAKRFKEVFDRGVSGNFLKRLAADYGIKRPEKKHTLEKRAYAFELMDHNAFYRNNIHGLQKALELKYHECTLNYVLHSIIEEYNARTEKPEPKVNIDLSGQNALVPDE